MSRNGKNKKICEENNRNRSYIASALITLLIVVMLIMLSPVSAVIVSIGGLNGSSITQGENKTFFINITLERSDTFVPFSNLSLTVINGSNSISAAFYPNGTRISGTSDISIENVTISPDSNYSGIGPRCGNDTEGDGDQYCFGYGPGFGFDSGKGGGNVSFIYETTISTINMSAGNYLITAYLNTGNSSKQYFNSTQSSFTISAKISDDDRTVKSGGSSGGGGGGGGTSGENYSNMILKEKYDLYIFKDKTTRYRFANISNPIWYVNITGNTSAGEITTSVELLKNTSALVKKQVNGIVYKNINIWVGTSGFAVPGNIRSAVIVFRVDSSWIVSNQLSKNDVKMFRWNGIDWVELVTTQISKDDNFYYYEALTNSFSPFVITGIKSAMQIPLAMDASERTSMTQPQETPGNTTNPKEDAAGTEQKPTPLLYIMIVIGIIAAVSYLYLYTVNRKK